MKRPDFTDPYQTGHGSKKASYTSANADCFPFIYIYFFLIWRCVLIYSYFTLVTTKALNHSFYLTLFANSGMRGEGTNLQFCSLGLLGSHKSLFNMLMLSYWAEKLCNLCVSCASFFFFLVRRQGNVDDILGTNTTSCFSHGSF